MYGVTDAGKTYYVKVQSICAVGDTSNWSPSFMFETNKTTPYTEAFDKIVNNMAGWQVSKSCSAEEVFAGTEIVYSSELTADTWTTDMLSTGLLSTIHMRTTVQNTSGLSNATLGSKTWLVSPIIDFTDATANYHLMFDLALTDFNADSAPSKEDMVDKDDRFMVIVSDDEGKTWKKENAIVWGATTDDYEYYNIPSTGKRYEFDLSKYAGKQIRVAFYAEANNSGATTEIHVDNVHINVSTTDIVESSVCQTEGFENQYFSYESNELVLGENSASYWEENTEKGKADVAQCRHQRGENNFAGGRVISHTHKDYLQ